MESDNRSPACGPAKVAAGSSFPGFVQVGAEAERDFQGCLQVPVEMEEPFRACGRGREDQESGSIPEIPIRSRTGIMIWPIGLMIYKTIGMTGTGIISNGTAPTEEM